MKATEVYRPEDFQSFKFQVQFSNVTTRTEVDQSKARLLEIGEAGVTLELPARTCNVRHLVMIKVVRPKARDANARAAAKPGRQSDFHLLFDATGKVRSAGEANDGLLRVEIDFVQFDSGKWREFLGIFQTRQEEIDTFLKDAKG